MPHQQEGPTRRQQALKLLLTGEPVYTERIRQHFIENGIGDVFYKLSYYLLQSKHKGAIIKAHRNGKSVVAYQLVNYKLFDSDGNYIVPTQAKQEIVHAA
jgi:hypothetical protein